jgi:hypothetical protein
VIKVGEVIKSRYDRSLEVITKVVLFTLESPDRINNYIDRSLNRVLGPMWDFAASYDSLPENRLRNPYSKKAKKSELEKISMN